MPAASTTLQLYDAIDIIDLGDGVNFALTLRGYQPRIAQRLATRLAGRGRYFDVIETAEIDIFGDDAAAVAVAVGELSQILERAAAWGQHGQGQPVRLKHQPQGSALTNPIEAVILGPYRPALPSSFYDMLMAGELEGVEVGWIRRGGYLGDEEAKTATAANQPTVWSITFTTAHTGVASVVDLAVTGTTSSTHLKFNPSILVVGGEDNVILHSAKNMTASKWTSVADASNEPADTNILRYTPTNTDESTSGQIDLNAAGFDTDEQRVAIFATVRNNVGSRTFYLRAEVASYDFSQYDSTDWRVIDGTNFATPQPILLGFANLRQGAGYVRFRAYVDATTFSPTLDIDQVVVLAANENGHIVETDEIVLASPFVSGSPNFELRVEHKLRDELAPLVSAYESVNSKQAPIAHEGDSVITMTGDELRAVLLTCNATDWTDTNQSSGARMSLNLRATRRPLYLVPQ